MEQKKSAKILAIQKEEEQQKALLKSKLKDKQNNCEEIEEVKKLDETKSFDDIDQLLSLSNDEADIGKVMLAELNDLEKQFSQIIQNVSKQNIIHQIESAYEKFCTDARAVFQQRMSQVLSYSISPEYASQKKLIENEVEKIKKARELIQKPENKNNSALFFKLGMVIGKIVETKNKVKEQLSTSSPDFEIKVDFKESIIQSMIRVQSKNKNHQPNKDNIRIYKRFNTELDQQPWNIGNYSAIKVLVQKNIFFIGFDSYRHMYSEDATLKYWVYRAGTQIELTPQKEVKLKRQPGYPDYLSKIYFQNPIFIQKGNEIEIRVQHLKAGVEEQKTFSGKDQREDKYQAIQIKNADRSPNGTDKTRGQIPSIHFVIVD